MFAKLLTSPILLAAILLFGNYSFTSAQSINFSATPLTFELGSTNEVPILYDLPGGGIVQIQLFDESWNIVDNDWVAVDAGTSSSTLTIVVPSDATAGDGYFFQGILYNSNWGTILQDYSGDVTLGPPPSSQFEMADLPLGFANGKTHSVAADYVAQSGGTVNLSLFDASGNEVDGDSVAVNMGAGNHTFSIVVPLSETGNDYYWQASVFANDGSEAFNEVSAAVTITSSTAPEIDGDDPLPRGTWLVDWNDEFAGDQFEVPSKWYPLIGYNPESYAVNEEKGLRWSDGLDAATARMYSVKDQHWLDGEGNLLLHVASDKTQQTVHGDKVETAYLLSGYPEAWDDSDPATNVRWAGKFVSPNETPLYISCRVKSNEVVGHSTWFAFWLFSKTRAYNSNPVDGTEVDIIEIAKGPNWLNESFNVANHWNLSGGSESKQFNGLSDPPAQFFVDVQDDQFHTYGLEWTTEKMTCYVDGVPCYTFTENVPSDPVDMMMLLTMEFQIDAWAVNQGDGRLSGPFVSDDPESRVMSRAVVDFVRVYKKALVSTILGDCNLDGDVNFFDIAPFIVLLSSGDFLEEADCNQDGVVNFSDIAPLIAILIGN